ncbi:MAG: endonuclease III [Candidatus Bathyarchaeota archaeon]|nr:endonuclease III [Candidatus Bathyarchaeota archaeon]
MKRPTVYLEPKKRVLKIIDLLDKEYTKAKTALNYIKPLELLVATILSSQCTDERVNKVTEKLFKKYRSVADYANADLKELEEDIRSTGFYRVKANYIKKSAQMINSEYQKKVPKTMQELIRLPGVARKTANIVLQNAYNITVGVAVDTHVKRLSNKLGLTNNKDPYKIEIDLMRIVPRNKWMKITDLLIFHGRAICKARKPKCAKCVLNKICPSSNIS